MAHPKIRPSGGTLIATMALAIPAIFFTLIITESLATGAPH